MYIQNVVEGSRCVCEIDCSLKYTVQNAHNLKTPSIAVITKDEFF